MLKVADEVVLDGQIALVDRRHERQQVHVLEHGARPVGPHGSVTVAPSQTVDRRPVAVFGQLLDRQVEFVAGDEVHRSVPHAAQRVDRHMGADKPSLERGVGRLKRLDAIRV